MRCSREGHSACHPSIFVTIAFSCLGWMGCHSKALGYASGWRHELLDENQEAHTTRVYHRNKYKTGYKDDPIKDGTCFTVFTRQAHDSIDSNILMRNTVVVGVGTICTTPKGPGCDKECPCITEQ